jgi:hypothetical protein
MHTAVPHFITSNMSLFVQDLFINSMMISLNGGIMNILSLLRVMFNGFLYTIISQGL